MAAQAIPLFSIDDPENSWREELFDFLQERIDHLIETTVMVKIEDISGAIFQNKSAILGQFILGFIKKNHGDLLNQEYFACPCCGKKLKAWKKKMKRQIETLAGNFDLFRPYFYCSTCGEGYFPLDEALGLAASPKQHDIQDVEAWLSSELPFKTSAEAYERCTGDKLSADHMFETAHKIAGQFDILDICPTKAEIEQKIAELSQNKFRRPVMMLAIDGAHAPTRPDPSPWKGKRGEGEYKEAKGFRLYLIDSDRIIHLISWHQVQNDIEFAAGLLKIKEAGLVPEDKVRLCIIADGAPWIWNKSTEIFPTAKQILDYYHCSEYIHSVANAHYGKRTRKAQEWVEATFTRLFHNNVEDVIRGLKIMTPSSNAAEEAIESANKFISHVRLKRSGAWWYISNANNILKLRCAKYNGTYDRIIQKYREIDREKVYSKF